MAYNYRKVSGGPPWIPLPLLKKREDGVSNFDPSTEKGVGVGGQKSDPDVDTNASFPTFLLTYHIVTGVSAFESVGDNMSHHLTQKQIRNEQTITFVKTAIRAS